MERRYLLMTLPVLGLLCSCQSEMIQDNTTPGRVITVKATLPGADETRTYISYGNPSIDYEFFRWDTTKEHGGSAKSIDYIALFNVSKLDQYPSNGIELDVTKIDGRSATFESVGSVNSDVEIKAGDILFVNYWETSAVQIAAHVYDPRKIFFIGLGSQANKPQPIVEHPDDASMSFMQGNLRMYDIVKVEEDDKVPDLHFKWLSAIMRVSLRNETGHDIYPTLLQMTYPGTESFFNVSFYCSVNDDAEGLTVYDGDDFYDENSRAYTDEISTTLNGKNGTLDAGESIKAGDTYDLYLSTVPRMNNDIKGTEGLIINLVEEHETGNESTYSINIKEFDVPVEAGKRYWFNLTAVEDEDGTRKLMYTSDWLKAHPDAKPYYE